MSDIFGPMFDPGELETAAEELLKLYFPVYLRQIELVKGLKVNSLKTPENYTQRNQFEATAGERLPKVVVISPGMMGTPQQDGTKTYRGIWRLGVGVATTGPTEDEASTKAKLYGLAVRNIIINHPSINGVALDTALLDEQYPDIPIRAQNRHYAAANILFGVEINNIVRKYAGPKVPADVYGIAEVVDTVVERV